MASSGRMDTACQAARGPAAASPIQVTHPGRTPRAGTVASLGAHQAPSLPSETASSLRPTAAASAGRGHDTRSVAHINAHPREIALLS